MISLFGSKELKDKAGNENEVEEKIKCICKNVFIMDYNFISVKLYAFFFSKVHISTLSRPLLPVQQSGNEGHLQYIKTSLKRTSLVPLP